MKESTTLSYLSKNNQRPWNPKHKIVPSIALSGSETAAFDDVGADDQDFESIQALAEAGIIPSKLSNRNTASDGSKGGTNFFPDRFISREELINWKALAEYDFEPGVIEQISRKKVDFMDLKDISPDSSPGLFIDMLAGEKSILRKVFGQSKRSQPNKPSSNAQAAVALTSGRMRFLNEKLDEERARGSEVEELYFLAVEELEQEKIVQEKCAARILDAKSILEAEIEAIKILKSWVEDEARKNQARAKVLEEVGRRWKWNDEA
ncbi:Cytochrome b561/ferric reductase transmembrane family protein [Hibiscus syriacus]|uniref:Cytochrome b561/ferric reductase transmembrane family protein n=1 Tax=Hibiscus syriacus TaxID=106335 RepID=A0A6A3AWV2_HIBSY|nr:Cytochrome b561/ferric reductase transmembrane family protein [Hibiscus syriacus]